MINFFSSGQRLCCFNKKKKTKVGAEPANNEAKLLKCEVQPAHDKATNV